MKLGNEKTKGHLPSRKKILSSLKTGSSKKEKSHHRTNLLQDTKKKRRRAPKELLLVTRIETRDKNKKSRKGRKGDAVKTRGGLQQKAKRRVEREGE